jgi:hypothetical protein
VVEAVAEPHAGEQAFGPAPEIARARTHTGGLELERHLDVLDGSQGGEKMEGLKDESDVGGAKLGPTVFGKIGESRIAQTHLAAGGVVQSRHQPK